MRPWGLVRCRARLPDQVDSLLGDLEGMMYVVGSVPRPLEARMIDLGAQLGLTPCTSYPVHALSSTCGLLPPFLLKYARGVVHGPAHTSPPCT